MKVRAAQPAGNPAPAIHDPQGRAQLLAERIAAAREYATDPDLDWAARKDWLAIAGELTVQLDQIRTAARIEVAA